MKKPTTFINAKLLQFCTLPTLLSKVSFREEVFCWTPVATIPSSIPNFLANTISIKRGISTYHLDCIEHTKKKICIIVVEFVSRFVNEVALSSAVKKPGAEIF